MPLSQLPSCDIHHRFSASSLLYSTGPMNDMFDLFEYDDMFED